MNDKLVSFSFSAISGFENCPRSFKYRYIDEIPSAFTSIEAWMGTSVHGALEWAYTESQQGIKPGKPDIIGKYRDFWLSGRTETVKVVKKGFSEDHYLNTGALLLEKFVDRVFYGDSSYTMALESRFRIEIAEGIFYKGVIDRVSRSEGGVMRATDFKTGRVGKPKDTLQLPSYGLFLFTKSIDEEIVLVYEDLKQEKTVSEGFLRKDAKEVKEQLLEKIYKIRECKEFFPMPSMLCSWCGYRDICDAAEGFEKRAISFKSGDSCPGCENGKLKLKRGRFGGFFGCSNYPSCGFTAQLVEKAEEPPTPSYDKNSEQCPDCGSKLALRNGRFGEFWGCTNFPECRFTREVKR